MKVGVEGVPFFGNLSGVGQYAARLINAASREDSDVQFEIVRSLMPHRKFTPPLVPNKRLSYRVIRWLPPIIYYQLFKRTNWALPYDMVALRKYDAFLFFNFVAFPVRRKTPSIVVIYDLSYALHPQYSSPKNREYLQKFVPKTLKRAAKIITISENSKQEIMDYYKIDPAMIEVIHPAVNHQVFTPQTQASVKKISSKYGIKKPYILSVCTLEPRKNLVGVLNAFETLPENLKQEYALVLVGGKGWLDEELQAKFDELSKKYTLIKTGYAPNEDLPALYSGASVFAYPSFYEGFGMPPLEAMACGTPVITSNNSSLPEVVGDAAITIEAHDTQRLAKNIERVLSDKKLAQSMAQKGLNQAKKFDWHKSAKKLISLIDRVVSE
jgi:glycosyltransferase involved in cell wall biosynthesis